MTAEPFRFLELPSEIRLRLYRLLFRQTHCDRHDDPGKYEPEYRNGTTEYLYNVKRESLVKQVVALPINAIHIDTLGHSSGAFTIGIAECCSSSPVFKSFSDNASLLLANKQIAAEASDVLYRENVFDFLEEVREVGGYIARFWSHPLESYFPIYSHSLPSHLLKRVELQIPSKAENLSNEDDSRALAIFLEKLATKRLGNVTNLRLRSRFAFEAGPPEIVQEIERSFKIQEMEKFLKVQEMERFLKAAAQVCAQHRFLKRTTISFQKHPAAEPKVYGLFDSWVTVELSAFTNGNNEMVMSIQILAEANPNVIPQAMKLSNDDGTMRGEEIKFHANMIAKLVDEIRLANDHSNED